MLPAGVVLLSPRLAGSCRTHDERNRHPALADSYFSQSRNRE
jgi:hypothetical protein